MKLLIPLFSILLFLIVIKPNDHHTEYKEKSEPTYKLNPDRDKNNWWYCPDNVKGFPPLTLKNWKKAPALNRRLPTKEETGNGTSLIFYDSVVYPDAKAYNITLPKLAWFFDPNSNKKDTVIVIQVVQTTFDTIVGYRYLTGGNGTYDFRAFHFLTNEEVKKAGGE